MATAPAQSPPVIGESLPIPSTTVKRDANGNVTGTDPKIDAAFVTKSYLDTSFVTKSYLTSYGASLAAAAAGGVTTLTAAVNITAGQLVYSSPAGVRVADYTTELAATVVGIATGAATAGGTVGVQYAGVFANFAAATMTPGTPIFLSASGASTSDPTTIPVGAFRTLIGYSITSSNLLVTVSEPSHIISGSSIKMGLGKMIIWPASNPGTIATLPAGILQCNGQSISRSYYSELFTLMNTTYGTTDGSSFNIPDWSNLNIKDSNGLVIGFYVIQAFSDVVYASNIASSFPVGSIYPQYVGFGTPASLFGGTWTDVSSSMPQGAKGGIYASGVTGGINYIQYSDGTMEQWGQVTTTTNGGPLTNWFGTASGTTYYSNIVVVFPIQFVGTLPVITVNDRDTNSAGRATAIALSQTNLQTFSPTLSASSYIQWRAIGKWSATAVSPVTFWQKTSTIGDAASTPPTLIQSAIYDSGSNTYGNWIRYTDGTMVCWGLSGLISGTSIGHEPGALVTFPISFISSPTITFSTKESTATGVFCESVNSISTSQCTCYVKFTTATGTTSIYWQATGKWSTQSVPAPLGGITVSGIFDSGSNANGNYIRYTDGTMIQWRRFPDTDAAGVNGWSAWGAEGTSFTSSKTITWPQPFIDTNYSATASGDVSAALLELMRVLSFTTTAASVVVQVSATTAGTWNSVSVMAIGKWSNTAVVPQTSQAVLMSGIYDSGTNANGNYIRYSEGTMIQWGSWTETLAITGANGTGVFYYNNTSWHNFPIPFISVPVTSISTDSSVWAEPRGTTAITMGISAMAGASETASRTYLWQAIGKWSNTAVVATTSFPTATTSPTVQDITVLGQRYNKNQVAFEAYLTGSAQAITAGIITIIQLNATNVNIGGAFNTSTFIFTAPYTGTYIFECNIQYIAGTSAHSAMPVNATTTVTNDGDWANFGTSTVADCNSSQTRIRYLTAGDTVKLFGYNGTTTTISATGRTRMSGYFLG
jgi:hypothetical protein